MMTRALNFRAPNDNPADWSVLALSVAVFLAILELQPLDPLLAMLALLTCSASFPTYSFLYESRWFSARQSIDVSVCLRNKFLFDYMVYSAKVLCHDNISDFPTPLSFLPSCLETCTNCKNVTIASVSSLKLKLPSLHSFKYFITAY